MKRSWPVVLVALMLGVALTAFLSPAAKVPADYDPSYIKPRVDWRDVVTYPPTEPGNAAEQYVDIVRQYYPPGKGVRWPDGEVLPPLLELAKQGARRKECNLSTEVLVLEDAQHRLLPATSRDDLLGHLSPLRNVGRALRAQGDRLYAQGKVEEAVRVYEAAVILGARLVEGRESTIQVLVGLAIQGDYDRAKKSTQNPITTLYLHENDVVTYRKWIEYYASLDEFRERFGDKLRRINAAAEDEHNEKAKPEDIEYALAVVLHDEDPLMKREAILALSTLREPPRRVKSILRRAERKDLDPYVREAAHNALREIESTS